MMSLRCCSFDCFIVLHSCMVALGSGFATLHLAQHGHNTALTARIHNNLDEIVSEIDAAVTDEDLPPPDALFRRLEQSSSALDPCRRSGILGEWHVWYSDAPPPSNGQLGPFRGAVSQYIDANGTYENRLCVGGENQWITSTLKGLWEEWDGVPIEADDDCRQVTEKDTATSEIDWGAAHTKVTFLTVEICALGFRLFQMTFPPNTCRIWRTTYLDDDIRLLRAGRTGKREDESVFYTKRKALS